MKIFSWNVNGLRAILSKNFCDFVKAEKPDVVCLQETKIDAAAADKLDLPFKYKYFSHADKKGYSGTAIFSNIEPKNAGESALAGHPNEGRICYADFESFRLVSAYIPNSQDELRRLQYRQKWDSDFGNYLKSQSPLVVCGDFNVAHNEIDIARPDANHFSAGFTDEERADFSKLLSDAKLLDIWRERNPDERDTYTWWSYRGGARARNVGWRIDYFLISQILSSMVCDCGISANYTGSDHCPIWLELSVGR